MSLTDIFDAAGQTYQQTRVAHWDAIARKRDTWRGMGRWYHQRLAEIYHFHIHPNLRVLEIGCGNGCLLASLKPARGVGIDFSEEMIHRAKDAHPDLEFIHADAHDLSALKETFDAIILYRVKTLFKLEKP